jgi:hypothetical protein
MDDCSINYLALLLLNRLILVDGGWSKPVKRKFSDLEKAYRFRAVC